MRDVKDAISRYLVVELAKARIGIASAPYDIVGLPPLAVRLHPAAGRRDGLQPMPAAAGGERS